MATSSSPITQVSQNAPSPTAGLQQPSLLTRLFLDLRGRRFEVERETIMSLPESVLLGLFPNGLVLSRQSVALADGQEGEDEEDIAVGPDGLRLISDCLASLFETNEEGGRTCRLCKYVALSFSFPLRYCTDRIWNYPGPDMLEA